MDRVMRDRGFSLGATLHIRLLIQRTEVISRLDSHGGQSNC
jgi:hypothetical protein